MEINLRPRTLITICGLTLDAVFPFIYTHALSLSRPPPTPVSFSSSIRAAAAVVVVLEQGRSVECGNELLALCIRPLLPSNCFTLPTTRVTMVEDKRHGKPARGATFMIYRYWRCSCTTTPFNIHYINSWPHSTVLCISQKLHGDRAHFFQ